MGAIGGGSGDELSEAAQVLGDGRQRELELGSARPAQSQAAEPQDALQVSEQHLDALPVPARLFEGLGLGERPSDIAGVLIHVARDLPRRCLRTASGFQRTCIAVALESEVAKRVVAADSPGGGQHFPLGAHIDIALPVEPEVFAAQRTVLALGLVDDGDVRLANDLAVPDNITLLQLPAYSPELNPVERLWLYLKQRFLSHRLLDDYDAIVDAACVAWNRLVAEVGRVKSLCTYPWIEAIIS